LVPSTGCGATPSFVIQRILCGALDGTRFNVLTRQCERYATNIAYGLTDALVYH
jgi:hypothetical protein